MNDASNAGKKSLEVGTSNVGIGSSMLVEDLHLWMMTDRLEMLGS